MQMKRKNVAEVWGWTKNVKLAGTSATKSSQIVTHTKNVTGSAENVTVSAVNVTVEKI